MITPILFPLVMGLSSGTPVHWDFGAKAADNGQVLITFTARLKPGWHLYATDLPSDDGPLPTEFRFEEHSGYHVKVPLTEPEAVEEYDPNFMMVVRHHSGEPRFTMVVEPVGEHPFSVAGEVEYMVCNDRTCLPPVVVPFDIAVKTIEPTEER